MFIVDVGGGTTECAVVAGGQIVRAQSLRLGGNAMDEAIVSTVKAELGLMLGRNAARSLKTTLGLADDGTSWMETVGVDAARRTPRVEHVPGRLVARALEHIVTAIVDSVQEMLSDIPPNLAEDVVRGKIRLAGGGALLPGLADRIEAATGSRPWWWTTRCAASRAGRRRSWSTVTACSVAPVGPEVTAAQR